MTKNDDTILEFLQDYGLALSPRDIEYNLETRHDESVSYSTVNRRLKKLLTAELVEKEYEKGGLYSITDRGERYLDGTMDDDEREKVENIL